MEGPSLVILKEQAAKFVGKKVQSATGAANVDFDRISGQTLRRIDTWGKHFLMVFNDCYIRIHYLMFGNYYIDSQHYNPEKVAKLTLLFRNGEWNNYNCAVKIHEGTDIDAAYDFRIDLMNDQWNPALARKTLRASPDRLVCDVLLDQQVFSGLGNIMKNETLFRTRIHPESRLGALPVKKLNELVKEARAYAFDFLRWKKEGASNATGKPMGKRPARAATSPSSNNTPASPRDEASFAKSARSCISSLWFVVSRCAVHYTSKAGTSPTNKPTNQ